MRCVKVKKQQGQDDFFVRNDFESELMIITDKFWIMKNGKILMYNIHMFIVISGDL